ncbi:hypothetical protein, partial [Ileibacterium valens]
EERMEQWQTALNRVIVCLVILFIEHEHILPKKAPHPLRIRCLFLFLDCQKFNSPFSFDVSIKIIRFVIENSKDHMVNSFAAKSQFVKNR